MKAIIQAGGMGTRLQPVTYEIPKPLVPVNKKPIINHLLELFRRFGFSDITIIANKNHEEDFYRWRKAWGDDLHHSQISITYEEVPRGTFGGLEPLREWVGTEPFLLSWSDELKSFDLSALARLHAEAGGMATMALAKVDDAKSYGVPILEGTRVVEFLEKPENPPSNFINAGLYMFEPKIFEETDWSPAKIMIEYDVFPKLAREGKLHAFRDETARWYDCGTLERWEKAMKEW